MNELLKLFLGLGTIGVIVGSIIFDSIRKERKREKELGCTCKFSLIGLVDHTCPVHTPFYIRWYKTIDNRVSNDLIYASYGKKEPVCSSCLKEIKPKGYIINFPKEVGVCYTCGLIKNIMFLPRKDMQHWKNNLLGTQSVEFV